MKRMTEADKQGLRIIQAVIKHKGTKRFRTNPAKGEKGDPSDLSASGIDYARQVYQKRLYQTAYGHNFGRKEVNTGDVSILKFKKISQLPASAILKPEITGFLDCWMQKGEHEHYLSKVIAVLRNLLTIVRTQKPVRATSKDFKKFKQFEVIAPDEFNKIFNKSMYTGKLRKNNSMPDLRQHQGKDYRNETKKLISNLFFKASPSKENFEMTKRRKDFLIHGNGQITHSFEPIHGSHSAYQEVFKGAQTTLNTGPMEKNSATFSSGFQLIPDPRVLHLSKGREMQMTNDLYSF